MRRIRCFSPLIPHREIAARWSPLTEREQEVLRLMAEGLSNKEIAARLGVSERTVAFHVSNVLQKLGAASRTEAVVKAKERGMIG